MQGRVAVAQEAETVVKGIVVDAVPVAMNEGADEQQQRGLGLMEICDEHLDNLVFVAGSNDNLCAAV